MADGTFSPVGTGEKPGQGGAIGPGSNTGQKGGALIDYFTVVLPESEVEDRGLTNLAHLVQNLFGTRDELVCSAIREKSWQFYSDSAVIFDREGEMVGRIGLGGNGATVYVSLLRALT